MRKLPFTESLRVIGRGSLNWMADRPIVVSFEVTDSCTCFCKHCDHGGPKDDSKNLTPEDYRHYMDELRPPVIQISGGEPLMRKDILDIVRAVQSDSGMPYTILVSNWSTMTEDKYLALREAGVNQFSVSLDFPDERHDEFRGYKGLYNKLEKIVPKLAAHGFDDIVMNTCITSWNVSEINAAADKAQEWGANISFSAYSPRRIDNWDYFLTTPEQLETLDREFARLKERIDDTKWILNCESTVNETQQYFIDRGRGGCKAGLRFLVVTSDGHLQPCSMQFKRYSLDDRPKLASEFTANNTCDQCYVSIRSNLDKNYSQLLWENVAGFFSFKPRHKKAPASPKEAMA
jgi:MoaA/NifB/PqqE/SkfB family radical SAM enzyme